jgi:dihydrofolate reductase
MPGKVFFSVSMSLDGYVAPDSHAAAIEAMRPDASTPGAERWRAQWGQLHSWVPEQRFFRENLKLGEGGKEGRDNAILEETFKRTGASIMGKRMFELGEISWPEEPPFHTPVYVLTHEEREPWTRPGGTTFYFVNDGIESALEQARDAAGDRDVRIAGGGNTILQYLNAGLIDEFSVALAPVFFGAGVRLFDRVDGDALAPEQVQVEPSSSSPVTHLTYALGRS